MFWSQGYDDFAQVPTPAANPVEAHNPSLHLDWKRFHSDLMVDFHEAQAAIIRLEAPGQFITHNLMGFSDPVDYFKLAASLDFVSHDQYPMGFFDQPQPMKDPATLAAHLDLMAGLKGEPFWVMEQQAGPTGWGIMGRTPRPGQLALWTAQSIARGADAVVYFRWRSCTVGTEQYWHGILPHNGVPGRRYEELKTCIGQLAPVMQQFHGALAQSEAAILFSYEQNWALEIQSHHPDLDYLRYAMGFYRAFHEANIPLAFISGREDLSRYRLIIAPLLFLDLPGLAARLIEYARGGGHLVLTMRSGVKNEDNLCQTDFPLPGPYAELLGIEILDYDCLRDCEESVVWGETVGAARLWWDVIELRGARGLAAARGGDHGGEAAITEATAGSGRAYYVGSALDPALMARFVEHAATAAGLAPLGAGGAGVELARRRTPEADYLFALNHRAQSASIALSPSWKAIIGSRDLGPYGFSLFRSERAEPADRAIEHL